MQKQYNKIYQFLTKKSSDHSQKIHFQSKQKIKQNLHSLIEVNKSLEHLLDSNTLSIFRKKSNINKQIDFDNYFESKSNKKNRIHGSQGYLFCNDNIIEQKSQQLVAAKNKQKNNEPKESKQSEEEQYNQQIDLYLKKMQSIDYVKNYLLNREVFIKQACRQIAFQMEEKKKSLTEKKRQSSQKYKLPKINAEDELIRNKKQTSPIQLKNIVQIGEKYNKRMLQLNNKRLYHKKMIAMQNRMNSYERECKI